ncbi:hypothetical protein ACCI36_004445 [Vibrio parahaemolyticus]
MNLLRKIVPITSVLLMSLSGCSSTDNMETDQIQFVVNYHDSDAKVTQGVPFFITYDPSQPEDLQQSARQSIANSRFWICNKTEACKFIPITVFLDYEIKKDGDGYDIKGALVTTTTKEMGLMSRSSFQLHLTQDMDQVVKNDLGAIATLEFKYIEPQIAF